MLRNRNAARGAASESGEPVPPVVPETRAGRTWVGIIFGILGLIVMLIFIFQNLHKTEVNFFSLHGHVALALSLFIAAILGALVVVLVGSIRILQLRRVVRRRTRVVAAAPAGEVEPAAGTAAPVSPEEIPSALSEDG